MNALDFIRAWVVKFIGVFVVGRNWTAAGKANREENWDVVVDNLRALHDWGWASDNSHHLLGVAYTSLEKHFEAISEFESIRTTLEDADCEVVRWLNYSLSLNHVGRIEEAAKSIPDISVVKRECPHHIPKAEELRRNISQRIGGRDDLGSIH